MALLTIPGGWAEWPSLVKACSKAPDSFGAPISNRLRIHEEAHGLARIAGN